MNDTDKIAAEATTGFLGYDREAHAGDADTWDALYEAFKSAIKKGTDAALMRFETLDRAAHASELRFAEGRYIEPPNDKIKLAAERLRHECETTEEPDSGFAKDILTLVEFAESSAAATPATASDTDAIEKAYSQGWHEGVRQCARKQQIEKERTAAPATASEQGADEIAAELDDKLMIEKQIIPKIEKLLVAMRKEAK